MPAVTTKTSLQRINCSLTAVAEILNNPVYAGAARQCADDFRSCPGVTAAADFIETAPHTSAGTDLLAQVNKSNKWFYLCYWLLACALAALLGVFVSWHCVWIVGVAAGVLCYPVGKLLWKKRYHRLAGKLKKNSM